MNDYLTIKREGAVLETIQLERPLLTVGRSNDADIFLDDPEKMVSRKHAIIQRVGQEYRIRNDEGKSGTFLNHARVDDWVPLRRGDLISIGSFQLLYAFGSDTVDDEATVIGGPFLDAAVPASPGRSVNAPAVPVDTARFKDPGSAPRVRLIFVKGPFKGGQQLIRQDRFTLGRDRHNTVWLNDATVSGTHAEIYQCVGTWFVRDYSSSNGIYVNNRLIDGEAIIKSGQRLAIGSSVAKFVVESAPRTPGYSSQVTLTGPGLIAIPLLGLLLFQFFGGWQGFGNFWPTPEIAPPPSQAARTPIQLAPIPVELTVQSQPLPTAYTSTGNAPPTQTQRSENSNSMSGETVARNQMAGEASPPDNGTQVPPITPGRSLTGSVQVEVQPDTTHAEPSSATDVLTVEVPPAEMETLSMPSLPGEAAVDAVAIESTTFVSKSAVFSNPVQPANPSPTASEPESNETDATPPLKNSWKKLFSFLPIDPARRIEPNVTVEYKSYE